jgi:hypothetical protein
MPRPHCKEKVVCRHFTWLLGRRDEVWQADGRSNRPNVGRHSRGSTCPLTAGSNSRSTSPRGPTRIAGTTTRSAPCCSTAVAYQAQTGLPT